MSIKYAVNEFGVINIHGKFPTGKIAALRESIRKWKWLVKYLEEHPDGLIPRTGVSTCTLCLVFLIGGCFNCPVYERTKRAYCERTPHSKYNSVGEHRNHVLAEEYAQKEVEFLESLLPKKVKK